MDRGGGRNEASHRACFCWLGTSNNSKITNISCMSVFGFPHCHPTISLEAAQLWHRPEDNFRSFTANVAKRKTCTLSVAALPSLHVPDGLQ
jgi:hypothetical protein